MDSTHDLGDLIPIAQIHPELPGLKLSSVHGVVTVVWPFNSVKNEIAFTLAEPQFRLRLNKGQVRVNFTGSCAKAISECRIGSNDEVRLHLAGAEFVPNEAKGRLRAAELDWQLNFSTKVLLQVKLGDADELKTIDIDRPEPVEIVNKPEDALPTASVEELPPLDPSSLDLSPPPAVHDSSTPSRNLTVRGLNEGEFDSPAFIKRERISYGSLFEDDIFEDDGGVKGRGRKRSRFGVRTGAWRYSSQSRSPEHVSRERHHSDENDSLTAREAPPETPTRPQMTDEGCQTSGFDIPGPDLPSLSLTSGLFQDMSSSFPEPNTFVRNGMAMDQGHQTFPIGGWESATNAQPSTLPTAPFQNDRERHLFVGPLSELAGADHRSHERWEPQSLLEVPNTYPELPLDVPHNGLVPGMEYPDSSLIDSFGTPELGDPGASVSQAHIHQVNAQAGLHAAPAENGGLSAVSMMTAYPDPEAISGPRHPPSAFDSFERFNTQKDAEHTMSRHPNPFASGVSDSKEPVTTSAVMPSFTSINDSGAVHPRVVSRSGSRHMESSHGQTPDSTMIHDVNDSDQDDGNDATAISAHSWSADHQTHESELSRDGLASTQGYRPKPSRSDIDDEQKSDHGHFGEDWDDSEEEKSEYGKDNQGGDYDTRTYLRPADDEDDSHDEDLRQHHLEPEFNDGDEEGSWDEDSEIYDEEEDYDDEELEEEQPDPPQHQRPRPPTAAPVVIDLLSSSEDEDEKEPPPPRRPIASSMPMQRSPGIPAQIPNSSPNYGPGSLRDDHYESQEEQEYDDNEDNDDDASDNQPEDEVESDDDQARSEDEVKELGANDSGSNSSVAPRFQKDMSEVKSRDYQVDQVDQVFGIDQPLRADSDMTSAKPKVSSPAHSSSEAVDSRADAQQIDISGTAAPPFESSPVDQDQDMDDVEPLGSSVQGTILNPTERQQEDEQEEERLSEVEVVDTHELDSESPHNQLIDAAIASLNATRNEVAPLTNIIAEETWAHTSIIPPSLSTTFRTVESSFGTQLTQPSSSPPTQSFQSQSQSLEAEGLIMQESMTSGSQVAKARAPTPSETEPQQMQEVKTVAITNVMSSDDAEANEIPDAIDAIATETRNEVALEAAPVSEGSEESQNSTKIPQGSGQFLVDTLMGAATPDVVSSSSLPEPPKSPEDTYEITNDQSHISTELPQNDSTVTDAQIPSLFRTSHVNEEDDDLQTSLRERELRHNTPPAGPVLEPAESRTQLKDSTMDGDLESSQHEEHKTQVEDSSFRRASPKDPSPVLGSSPKVGALPEPGIEADLDTSTKANDKLETVQETADDMSDADPSVKLARAAIAIRKGHRRQATPETTKPHTRSKSLQKSPSPGVEDESVQLAKASLYTPSKIDREDAKLKTISPSSSKVEEETGSLTQSKLQLVRHLRDELGDYTNLKVLRHHMSKSLDVVAVAMMDPADPQRAKGGPREYMMSFTITDHSIAPSAVAEVQLYRPHKESLPIIKAGDVVLLRNFTVLSLKEKGWGLRTNDGSSWAVFDKEDEPAQIKGPPVEYGDAEIEFARYLREWYGLLDDKAKQRLEKANQKIIDAGRAGKKA